MQRNATIGRPGKLPARKIKTLGAFVKNIIMWLPKDEKKLLVHYYQELHDCGVGARTGFYLSTLEKVLQGTNARNRARISSERLQRRNLIAFLQDQGDAITVGLSLEGHDLGKKYSSKPGTAWVWCNEYKFWVILTVIIGLIGLLVMIFKD